MRLNAFNIANVSMIRMEGRFNSKIQNMTKAELAMNSEVLKIERNTNIIKKFNKINQINYKYQ